MAAPIQREYPNAWPETIRALIVHSAEWSNAMRQGRNLRNEAVVSEMLRSYLRPKGAYYLRCQITSKTKLVSLPLVNQDDT